MHTVMQWNVQSNGSSVGGKLPPAMFLLAVHRGEAPFTLVVQFFFYCVDDNVITEIVFFVEIVAD